MGDPEGHFFPRVLVEDLPVNDFSPIVFDLDEAGLHVLYAHAVGGKLLGGVLKPGQPREGPVEVQEALFLDFERAVDRV
jgi:hypothetical protein